MTNLKKLASNSKLFTDNTYFASVTHDIDPSNLNIDSRRLWEWPFQWTMNIDPNLYHIGSRISLSSQDI